MRKQIAIVGAGVSGLACAMELVKYGHQVTVFEKSRGPGGRMPTRWLDRDIHPPLGFDHGTQYFQASAPVFLDLIKRAEKAGAAAPWNGVVVNTGYGLCSPHISTTTRWVGAPGMASLARFMANGLDVRLECRVSGIAQESGLYQLTLNMADGTELLESGFDVLVCAVPAEQVVPLFDNIHKPLADLAAAVQSNVTWSVMLTPREVIKVDFDGAFVADSPLGWVCRDSSKPGRSTGDRWMLQATADWSRQHQDYSPNDVNKILLQAFCNVSGQLIEAPLFLAAHRWLYSLPINPVGVPCYFSEHLMLGACGDWLSGTCVEDAFMSGHALGHQLLNAFGNNQIR